ncbi:hypothetical protein HLV35_03035 [Eggerthellaceae bacterium zg-997]|nr:hypothetical protein [Eggerthellaceae bacterium zg-997]
MPLTKPDAIASDAFRSAKWDELTAGRESFAFCFQGVPRRATVAVSAVGCRAECLSQALAVPGRRLSERRGREGNEPGGGG